MEVFTVSAILKGHRQRIYDGGISNVRPVRTWSLTHVDRGYPDVAAVGKRQLVLVRDGWYTIGSTLELKRGIVR